jgi:hypothetical protein
VSAPDVVAALDGAARPGAWWCCECVAHYSRALTLAAPDDDRGVILICRPGSPYADILDELRRRGLLGGGTGCDQSPPSSGPAAKKGEILCRSPVGGLPTLLPRWLCYRPTERGRRPIRVWT